MAPGFYRLVCWLRLVLGLAWVFVLWYVMVCGFGFFILLACVWFCFVICLGVALRVWVVGALLFIGISSFRLSGGYYFGF